MGMMAQSQDDGLKEIDLDEVSVVSTRAGEKTPIAHTNVSKEQIAELNSGKDIPFLLSMTPSVTTTSDAGNGVGYTSLRVRGIDPTRINITANGIPLNDAESAQIYWVNMGDFASSAENIQIQRGAGTSTNGAGAFGATVNIQTAKPGMKPSFGVDLSGGSYGTHKESFKFSTGLLGDHWALQGRVSNICSDGYLDRATSRLGSYFVQGGYYGDKTMVKFITFNGWEKTYHAWNYTSKYEQSLYGRTYNSCGEYYDAEGNRRYYGNQIDKFHQQHYNLTWNQLLTPMLSLNVVSHYTHDDGYYEQYKVNKKLYKYNLTDENGSGKTKSDVINQKKHDGDFYGFIASLNFDNKQGLTANIGGAWSSYGKSHRGKVLWAEKAVVPAGFQYYDNDSRKTDGNIYGKVNYEFLKGLSAYADLQYRRVSYLMGGFSDEYDDDNQQIPYEQQSIYNFFNPKFGLFYHINKYNNVYGSFSIAHREPTRNDFQDHVGKQLQAERLVDWELGYKYQSPKFTAGINFYLMNYNNQFVLTGKLNEVGEMIAESSGKSYRAGIELEAAYQPVDWFRWDVNATFSRNRNKDWTVSAVDGIAYENTLDQDDPDWNSQGSLNLGSTKTSFSPEVIFNNILTFRWKGLKAQLMSQYTGKQYMTNTGFDYAKVGDDYVKMILSDYFTNNIDLSYTFHWKGLKSATIGATLYNLTSLKYDNNGWAYCEVGKDQNGTPYAWTTDLYESGFAPQAPIHFMAHLSLNF